MRSALARQLAQAGYLVYEAKDGLDALEQFESLETRLDFLLTDIVMPGLDGLELSERILMRNPKVHVLTMSGEADLTAMGLVPVLSQKYYLQKPFGIELLKAKLRNLVPTRAPKLQRLLLVDPNSALRSFKRLGLISEGFEVDAVSSAEEAIEQLRLQSYDAVVSENEMGSLDGLELWQAIRSNPNLRSLRMILASKSLEDPQLRDRAEAMGLKDLVILGPGDFGSLALELRRRL